MSAPEWNFEPLSPNAEEHGISEWDQFDKEDLGIDSTLLREATQNSLDARDTSNGQSPVRVRIQWLHREDLAEPEWFDELLSPTLGLHLNAAGRALDRPKYAALVVEDFGTTGLTGRTDNPADPGNFRGFFYRHSISDKRGAAGGRWGLGKLVFARMSAWSCWFGLTTRADGRTLLMGKAAIAPRQVDDTRYPAFARWAVLEDGPQRLERPVEDQKTLRRFRRCFQLQRSDGEPGLSVVVPWPKSDPNIEEIRRSVLKEWAVPILGGRLVFEIQNDVIDAAVATTLLPQVFGERAANFIEAVASDETAAMALPELRPYPEAGLDEGRLDATVLETLRARYAVGEVVSVRLPIILPRKEAQEADCGHVRLHLARAAQGERAQALRLRDDITVPRGVTFAVDGVHNALVAEEGPAAEFLADAEPPAHDNWTVTTRLRERWRYERRILNLIRTALAKLYHLLAAGAERDLPDELLQFFWFEDPAGSGNGRARAKRQQRRTPETPSDLPPPRPRQLTIDQERGGFAVRAGPGLTADLLPCRIRVSVAYDLEDGDPLRLWSPYDFNLGDAEGDLEIEQDGARIIELRGNQVLMEARDQAFRLRVHGFDPNRDLEVRVNRLREGAP
jgi:hypothetical protein